MSVSYARQGRIGLITIDNPPVNATGHAVRQGLMDAARDFAADTGADAAVILCAGRTWVALMVDTENATGAVGLYESVGMHQEQSIDVYQRVVLPDAAT